MAIEESKDRPVIQMVAYKKKKITAKAIAQIVAVFAVIAAVGLIAYPYLDTQSATVINAHQWTGAGNLATSQIIYDNMTLSNGQTLMVTCNFYQIGQVVFYTPGILGSPNVISPLHNPGGC